MATVDSVLGQTQDAVGLCRRKVLVPVQAEGRKTREYREWWGGPYGAILTPGSS